MKKVIGSLVVVIVVCFIAVLSAQNTKPQTTQAQKVHSIVKITYKYDWYIEQHKLWKYELEKRPDNAEGWLNYYTAARMAKLKSPSHEIARSWKKEEVVIVENMKEAIKGTYEYHYIQGYYEDDKYKAVEHLTKAYNMDPNRVETYAQLLTYYELIGDKAKLTEIAKRWKASGDLSPNDLLLNYNMLNSTEENSILITYGDMDTYPSLVLQQAENVRKDVTVINSSLICLEKYRTRLFKELNLPEFPLVKGDTITSKKVIDHIIKYRGDRPLYFGIATGHKYVSASDLLFNVGLAMRYSDDQSSSLSFLIKNFEQNLMLDHLKCSVYSNPFPINEQDQKALYIPGLLMLYKHYVLIGAFDKKKNTKELILKLTKGNDQEVEIGEYLANIDYNN